MLPFFRIFCVIIILIFDAGSFYAQKTSGKSAKNKTGKSNFFTQHKPSSRDFHSIGHSLFTDFNLLPIVRYDPDSLSIYDTLPTYSRLKNYNIYHVSYYFRYNIFQLHEEKVISLTINPGIGLGLSQSKKINGFGILNGSVSFGYEWGAGASYRSIEERGYFVRAGAEIHYAPLLIIKSESVNNDSKSWVGPVVSAGFRKENSKGKLIETNLKIGWGFKKVNYDGAISPFIFSRPFSFRFSFVIFLDH